MSLNVIIEQEIAKLGVKSIRASDLVNSDETEDIAKLRSILYVVGHPEDITQPRCQDLTDGHIL